MQRLLKARLGRFELPQAIEGHRQIIESLQEGRFNLNGLGIALAALRKQAALNQDRAQCLPSAGAIRFTPNRKPGRGLGRFRVSAPIENLSMIAMPNCGRLGIDAGPRHESQRSLDVPALEGRHPKFVQDGGFRPARSGRQVMLMHAHFSLRDCHRRPPLAPCGGAPRFEVDTRCCCECAPRPLPYLRLRARGETEPLKYCILQT